MLSVTAQQLAEALNCPSARAAAWVDALNAAMERFEINTPERVAEFIAQVGHESAAFTRLEENLNYTATGLRATFPSHFTNAEITAYQHWPEAIANRVYAHRMGNGDEAGGDGWAFRGRGLVQLTGRNTYRACGDALGLNLMDHPDLLLLPANAALSAAWFWQSRGCNELADAGDFKSITFRINGGLNGWTERIALFERASAALA